MAAAETTDAMMQAVREYTARGWVIHPLHKITDPVTSPGKQPIVTGWSALTCTIDDIGKYIKQGYNIGLVCGKASGVNGFDIDLDIFASELFDGVELNTLISAHRDGRGHILVEHDDDLFSDKRHFIGIEYFGTNQETGTGTNLVLPPSMHHSGEIYKWKDASAPLMKMPERMKQNWIGLVQREEELHNYFKKCRHCFTAGSKKYDKTDVRSKGLWDRPDNIAVHGMDGRRAIIAIMGELKSAGCPNNLLHMACKRFFGKDYNFKDTEKALKGIDPIHPKCETLRQYLNVECDGCAWKPSAPVQIKEKEYEKKCWLDVGELPDVTYNTQIKQPKLDLTGIPASNFLIRYVSYAASMTDAYTDYHIAGGFSLLSIASDRKARVRFAHETIYCNTWQSLIGDSTVSRKTASIIIMMDKIAMAVFNSSKFLPHSTSPESLNENMMGIY